MTHFAFPYGIDARGRTRSAGEDDHIRNLIEMLLLTSPGERINRPELGSDLMGLVFAPNDPMQAAMVEASVRGAITRWLGELITVERVEIAQTDGVLRIGVHYVRRADRGAATATVEMEAS